MKILNMVLSVAVCLVVPLIVWRKLKWPRILLAISFFGMQIVLMLHMNALGRTVMAGVINSGGAVRDVSEALMVLKEAQWPAAIALVISGAGLFVLAAFQRSHRVQKENVHSQPEIAVPR